MKLYITIIAGLLISNISFAADRNCILHDGLNIETAKRLLFICSKGNIIKEFKIALGSKGTGKKVEGDKKTPLGLYKLATPRHSTKFGIFIPIQYPTSAQVSAGYTGTNVGIHGPIQPFKWLGPLNALFNWTAGCVAVAKNEHIAFVAKWIREHPKAKIFIS